MNRIEYLSGRRWASSVLMDSLSMLKLAGGHEKLLEMLSRGLVQKPSDYAAGVQDIITIVEDARDVRAMRGAA